MLLLTTLVVLLPVISYMFIFSTDDSTPTTGRLKWEELKLKVPQTPVSSSFPLTTAADVCRCGSPSLEAWNKDVIPFYSSQPKEVVNCPKLFNPNSPFEGVAFQIRNGNQLHRLVDMGLRCCFRKFEWTTDNVISHASTCFTIRNQITVIPNTMDFIQVICQGQDHQKSTPYYLDAFPLVHPPQNTVPKTFQFGSPDVWSPLNIVIIGLESVSRQNFMRMMPLTSDYLVRKMGAISFEGYSTLGQLSRNNIGPMLTGFSKDCGPVYPNDLDKNKCPFIWKEFSERGYITNFAEDGNIFNGFSKPPTDFYLRPYTLHMEKVIALKMSSQFCFGPRLAFQAVLDYVESVREVAQKVDRPHFQFTWTGRLQTHDDLSGLGHGDVPLLRSLMKFEDSGARNNTVIMILGDHGHEKNRYFQTTSGQMEYRMPLAYIALPPWFPKHYPVEYRNLKDNSKGRLTTSLDIYKTLRDLMDLGGQSEEKSVGREGHQPGISLFTPISIFRSCLEAGISLKWCNTCHKRIPVHIEDPVVTEGSNFVVKSLNSRGFPDNWSVERIITASKWDPRDVFMEMCDDDNGKLRWSIRNIFNLKFTVSCSLVEVIDLKFQVKYGGSDNKRVLNLDGPVVQIKYDNLLTKMFVMENM